MKEYIAIFWSRHEAFSFSNKLRQMGILTSVITTPKEAGRTCGLSVKIGERYFDKTRAILSRFSYSSFGGWLVCENIGGRYLIRKL